MAFAAKSNGGRLSVLVGMSCSDLYKRILPFFYILFYYQDQRQGEFTLIAVRQKRRETPKYYQQIPPFHFIFLKCLFKNTYFVPEKGNIGCPNPRFG